MNKDKKFIKSFFINLFTLSICSLFLGILFNKVTPSYYMGKIESINRVEDSIITEVSPVNSTSTFAKNLKSNHKIEFKESTQISGLTSRNKEKKYTSIEEMYRKSSNLINNFEVGDSIIFKVNYYSKKDYKLSPSELAFDLGD